MKTLPVVLSAVVSFATAVVNVNAGSGVTFQNVAIAAGVDCPTDACRQWISPPFCQLPCSEMPYMTAGAAAGDYDSDGWVDLYVTRIQAPNQLFRNLGNGTFADVAAAAGVALNSMSSGCAWGDIDNDGDLDLYVITISTRYYLYVNNGSGQFTEEAVARGIDLGAFQAGQGTSAAFGDYDKDGALDLSVAQWRATGQRNRLFHNNGNGFFTDVTTAAGLPQGYWGFANGFADIDGDTWPDLLVAADFGTSRLFRNLGNGTFQNITVSANVGTDENGMGSTIGDIDGDGDFDWFVTSIYDENETCETQGCNWGYTGNRLYRNEGGAVFSDGTDFCGVRHGYWGWGTSFLDFDNDGDLDLGMTNGVVFDWLMQENAFNNDPVRLWENDGTGQMTEVSATSGFVDTGSGKGFVVFDYDNDGDEDVFIANNAAHPMLFRNDGGNANSWLRVKLRGVFSNKMGVGAIVRVQVNEGGPVQTRFMHANSNYMSQNEAVVHFGLGPGVTTVHSVEIDWPVSAQTATYNDVSANQVLTLTEPGSVPAVSSMGLFAFPFVAAGVAILSLQRIRQAAASRSQSRV